MAAPLEDCCGLGCNNCILDRFLDNCARRPNFTNKFNLFNQKSYQKFRVKNIVEERHLIYQFTFELICDRTEPFQSDEQLIAPPISYLMMRAKREFEGEVNPIFKNVIEFLEPDEDCEDNERFYRSQAQRFDKGTPEIYFSRKYTPFEVNEEMRTFKIIVKLEEAGKMSRYFTRLIIGSVCEFKGPFEAFNYIHEAIENYIVFTQGEFIISC